MYNSAMTSDKQELWHSDEALADLLRGPEGDLVEWKESAKGDAVPKAICAFANDLHDRRKPGVVFVGADDKGNPTGLAIDEELLNNLAGIRSESNILPPPSLRVTPLSAEGGQVACVQVMPSPSPPVQFKGRIYVRDGASTRVAVAADEHVLAEKRRLRDAPFELRPFPAASMEKDLDLQYFEKKYLPALVPPEVLAENDRSLEQRLAASKMIAGADDPTPTALGLLVAGVNAREFLSGAHVQFLRIDGDELGENIIDAEEIYGNISQVVRDSEKKMRAYNRVAVKYVTVPLEERSWLYPPAALEQIFRNAILHRSYEKMTSPVDIRWYNDRVEIISPGGPFGAPARPGLSAERASGISQSRPGRGDEGAGTCAALRHRRGPGAPRNGKKRQPAAGIRGDSVCCYLHLEGQNIGARFSHESEIHRFAGAVSAYVRDPRTPIASQARHRRRRTLVRRHGGAAGAGGVRTTARTVGRNRAHADCAAPSSGGLGGGKGAPRKQGRRRRNIQPSNGERAGNRRSRVRRAL